jgi:hypothetical protein
MKIARQKRTGKKLVIAAVVAALLAVGAAAWYVQGRESSDNGIDQAAVDRGEAEEREQGMADRAPFGAEDTEGRDVDTSSQGISSESGAVTLYSPGENDLVRNGSVISGTASVSTVNYEIADSGRGLIAQGQANVVNGRFSITINNLNPSGTEGSLRVFTFDPDTYREANHVNISIRLQP